MKKEQNGRESLRKLKPILCCNAIKRRRRIIKQGMDNVKFSINVYFYKAKK